MDFGQWACVNISSSIVINVPLWWGLLIIGEAMLVWKKKVWVAQSCPALWDPMDCSLSGSSVYGILQARILEWVVITFSRGSSQPRDRTWVSHIAGRHFTLMASKMAESQWLQADSRAIKGKKMDFPLEFNLYFGPAIPILYFWIFRTIR